MKRLIVLLAPVFFLVVNPVAISETLYWDDGLFHTINDNAYENDHIRLDYQTTNNPGTHLELVDGTIGQLDSHRNATITMTGGSVGGKLEASGSSTITMISGSVGGNLTAHGGSTVTMSGGSVGNYFQARMNGIIIMAGGSVERGLEAINNGTITMSGGSVGTLGAGINGTIYLNGTGFKVDGQTLTYGDKLSDFVPLVVYRPDGNIYDCYTGTVTGTLADGSALNTLFAIYNTGDLAGTADIYIIPEPATVILLGFGGLILRSRKK